MTITELEYGNPSIDLLQYLNEHSYLDILFTELTDTKYTFPGNDTGNTRTELNDLVKKCAISQTDEETLKRFESYDRSLPGFYNSVTFDKAEEIEQYRATVLSVFQDTLPLIFKLKVHYQRPRPFQLANYHKLKLFPFHSYSADSPSYPSLHACMGKVLAGVLGNQYPTASKYFNDVGQDAGISRMYLGLNFQSSRDMGIITAEKILSNKEFQVKYKI